MMTHVLHMTVQEVRTVTDLVYCLIMTNKTEDLDGVSPSLFRCTSTPMENLKLVKI